MNRAILLSTLLFAMPAAAAYHHDNDVGGICDYATVLGPETSYTYVSQASLEFEFPSRQSVELKDIIGSTHVYHVGSGQTSRKHVIKTWDALGNESEQTIRLDFSVDVEGTKKTLRFEAEVLNPYTGALEVIERTHTVSVGKSFLYLEAWIRNPNLGEKQVARRLFCVFER